MRHAVYAEETIEKYEKYINPALARLFRCVGLTAVERNAAGCIVWDSNGRQYIDCLGGYGTMNCGHRHPKIIEAVKNQLDFMPLSSKVLFNKPMADLAELLAQITPGDLQYSFICNSGTEAVEGALKLARLHTGKSKVIAMQNGFHGKTFGALSATGRAVFCQPFQPLLAGFQHVPFGDEAALRRVLDEDTAAVIVEPIQGEGGVVVPPDWYLPYVRDVCSQFGALLICDEVQTGLGRTGKMFAVEHYGVTPDILTVAKALGGGVMPIGAFCARGQVWEEFAANPLLHTSTFGGNPLACAAAIAAIHVLREEGLVHHAAIMGEYLLGRLAALSRCFPAIVKAVRGKGLLIGVELTEEGMGGALLAELLSQGILVAYTLNNPKVIRIEPPLNIAKSEADVVLDAFAAAVAKLDCEIEDFTKE